MLKPDIRQMLETGKDYGLYSLGQVYTNYMNNYDCYLFDECSEDLDK